MGQLSIQRFRYHAGSRKGHLFRQKIDDRGGGSWAKTMGRGTAKLKTKGGETKLSSLEVSKRRPRESEICFSNRRKKPKRGGAPPRGRRLI